MRQNRLPLVVLMAASLVAASLWRESKPARVARADPTATTRPSAEGVATQNFSQFNSYTLGLLLGGLRGPLVMTLWSSSETQKSERNLEDINTKIELIGMLQPEFDTVHLFQIWNKAYNLSVQMANLSSKYSTILDAIDYADKRRKERPQNLNLESALASIYFDKLGNSAEKTYYRERVRDETLHPLGQVKFVFPPERRDDFVKLALDAGADSRRFSIRPEQNSDTLLTARLRADYGERMAPLFTGDKVTVERIPPRLVNVTSSSLRSTLDPRLDATGKLLPEYANHNQPSDLDDLEWRPQDGELGYLVRFEPYPYGLSPYALAYNYYKRGVSLQERLLQKHSQLSERVISSRPALSLKNWSEEEIERGRLAEMAQYGLSPTPSEQAELPFELPASKLPVNRVKKTPLIEEAIACYARASQLADAAVKEYRQHVRRYTDDSATYVSHMAHSQAMSALAAGDALFLQAAMATGDEHAKLAQEATQKYTRALELLSLNVIAFFTPEELLAEAIPKGYGKADAMNAFETPAAFPTQMIAPTIDTIYRLIDAPGMPPMSEIQEYRTYSARAALRLQTLSTIKPS